MRIVKPFIEKTGISLEIVFVIIAFVVCVCSFYSIYVFSGLFYLISKKLFLILSTYKFYCLILLSIYFLAFLAIFNANYYYTDDLGRTIEGYEITGAFSRYTANLLSEILHGNTWLADVSPLPQILALSIMAISGVLLIYIVCDTLYCIKPTLWSVVAMLPMTLSPFFLSCLSYRYDSPYMALSVFASVVPFVFLKSQSVKFGMAVCVGTIIMCTTYQASSGLVPMIACVIALLMWIQRVSLKSIGIFILSSMIGYICGLLVFRIILMESTQDTYVDTTISFDKVFENLNCFCQKISFELPVIWIALFIVLAISFLIFLVARSRQNKLLSFFISIVSLLFMFMISFGAYLLFRNPSTTLRSFYGLGILASLISIPFFCVTRSKCVIGKFAIITLSLGLISFSFIYGNSLHLQKEYISFRTEQIINDLNDLNLLSNKEKFRFQFVGSAGYHNAIKNMIKQYPVLKDLIPVLLSDSTDWQWGSYQFREYYGLNTDLVPIKNISLNSCVKLKDTYYHTIYLKENYVVINIKDVKSESEYHTKQ